MPAKGSHGTLLQNMHSISPPPGLNPLQRIRVDALLDELLDLPEEARLANLGARSAEDPAVLAEVRSLLRAAHASGGFLDEPPHMAPDDVVR